MHPLMRLVLAACVFTVLWNAADVRSDEESPAEPIVTSLQGLPPSQGRQILTSDGAGNAFILQLSEKRVFRVDELTGSVHLDLRLESDTSIAGALRAAVGNEGKTWVFQFAPHFVRVFENGAEVEIEQPGAVVTGVAVTRGRPTLALDTARPDMGSDVARNGVRRPTPPLVVQLGSDGEWQPWIERGSVDRVTREDARKFGILGFETRLAGDQRGRLLMARRYLYDVREYQPNGKLANRMTRGGAEMEQLPDEIVEQLEAMGRSIDRNQERPKVAVEGVAWSPEGEVLILATTDGGYVLDRWVGALQEHSRLALEELKHPPSRFQLATTRNGLLLLPVADTARMVFIPWNYLRDAKWESLQDEASPAPPGPSKAASEGGF